MYTASAHKLLSFRKNKCYRFSLLFNDNEHCPVFTVILKSEVEKPNSGRIEPGTSVFIFWKEEKGKPKEILR